MRYKLRGDISFGPVRNVQLQASERQCSMTISTCRVSRRRFLTGTAALAATLKQRRAWAGAPDAAAGQPTRYVLHFAQPAAEWPDALPVGNGRLGAMVFG